MRALFSSWWRVGLGVVGLAGSSAGALGEGTSPKGLGVLVLARECAGGIGSATEGQEEAKLTNYQ
jgi:hypothetical protein